MPITRGLLAYLLARNSQFSKNLYSGNSQLHHKPSPSSSEQHHCEVLVWLLRITISPTSVNVLTVWSNIQMPVLPISSGLALRYFSGTGLSSQKSCREQVSRIQFILNLCLMSKAMSHIGLHSSPSTQCRHMCPPDQLPPASLTLLPVASTILIPCVDRGRVTSSTLNRGRWLKKSATRSECLAMILVSAVMSAFPMPIYLYCTYCTSEPTQTSQGASKMRRESKDVGVHIKELPLKCTIFTWNAHIGPDYSLSNNKQHSMSLLQQFSQFLSTHSPLRHQVPFPNLDKAIDEIAKCSVQLKHMIQLPSVQPLINLTFAALQSPELTFEQRSDLYHSVDAWVANCLNPTTVPSLVPQLLNLAVTMLAGGVSPQVDQKWAAPAVTASRINQDMEEDHDQISVIEDILSSQGSQREKDDILFLPLFNVYMMQESWTQVYGALIIASKVVRAQNFSSYESYCQYSLTLCNHPHPKVKYAALELISSLIGVDPRLYQQAYLQNALQTLTGLINDPIPRVSATAMNTFMCLSKTMGQLWILSNYAHRLLPTLNNFLQNGIPYIQEVAMKTIAMLCACKAVIGTNENGVMEVCRQVIEQMKGQDIYEETVHQAFVGLAVLVSSPDLRFNTKDNVHQFFNLMMSHQSYLDNQTFLGCWQVICEETRNPFELSLSLFDNYMRIFKSHIEEQENQQDIDTAFDSLDMTFRGFKGSAIRQYFHNISEFLNSVIDQKEIADRSKQRAMKSLAYLMCAIQPLEHENTHEWKVVRQSNLSYMMSTVENSIKERESDKISAYLIPIKTVLSGTGKWLENHQWMTICYQLKGFEDKLVELYPIKVKKDENQPEIYEGDEGDSNWSDSEATTGHNEVDEDDLAPILETLSDIYEIVLKNIKGHEKKQLYDAIVNSAGNYIAKESDDWKGFAFGLCAAVLASCSYEQLSCFWGQMMTLFTQYSQSQRSKLRNYAVFNMGQIFEKTPSHLVQENNIQEWLNMLSKSMTAPYSSEEIIPRSIQYAKDNIVAALGKLLRCFASKFPTLLTVDTFRYWLTFLPLYEDEIEGEKQQILLCEMLESHPRLLINCEADLVKIFEVFGKFMIQRNPDRNCEALMRVQSTVQKMQGWDMMVQSSNYLASNLPMTYQLAIQELLKRREPAVIE